MIDTHCHLEQPDYDADREAVIERCSKILHAVIISCANPKYFNLTMELVKRHSGFIFATASVHPQYVKAIDENLVTDYLERIRSNRDTIVAIGETGLDYNWIKEAEWRVKQKHLFANLITLAERLQRPLVIHSRDATEDVISMLEERGAKSVQMHMFTSRPLLKRVIDNGWLISVNTLLLTNKTVKKIVRDCPLEQMMLETDSPWLGIGKDGTIKSKNSVRNEPTAVNLVAKEIADIKKLDLEDVDRQTTNNALDFFQIQCSN